MPRLDARIQIHRIETLNRVAEEISGVLSGRHKVDGSLAREIGLALVEQLIYVYGGATVTVPKDRAWFRTQRDEALLRDFNGRNHEELAVKYRMLKSSVYAVVKNYQKPTGEAARAEMMVEVVDHMEALLIREHGYEQAVARRVGHDVADMLASQFGGIQLTIPDGFEFETLVGHAKLLKAFTGDNHQELAVAQGLTVAQVHEVLLQYRRLPVTVTA